MAKPLKCRLRLHNWEDRENPETHERYQGSVCAVTPTETEGMQPPVQAQLESPVQASAEGYLICPVQQRSTATTRFTVSS